MNSWDDVANDKYRLGFSDGVAATLVVIGLVLFVSLITVWLFSFFGGVQF